MAIATKPRRGDVKSVATDNVAARFMELIVEHAPLWPTRYADDNPDCAFRFLIECCWTYNEADRTVELIPSKDYIGDMAYAWWQCRLNGRPFIVEKSRRLIISWVERALIYWSMGLAKEKRVLAGLNYHKAAEHVWRLWWLHQALRDNRGDLHLPPCIPRGGNVQAGVLEQVILPNGSLLESLNQEGESFQGSGYAGVTMEEFSLYKHADYMYNQAKLVTQGKPDAGFTGGHITIITNAAPNLEWRKIKCRDADELRRLDGR